MATLSRLAERSRASSSSCSSLSVSAHRVTITGFSISDHVHRLPWFVPRMARWIAEGSIVYDEDIVEGIDALPGAFLGMLAGDNIGKRMVRVGPDTA